jgi:hypothetical protein
MMFDKTFWFVRFLHFKGPVFRLFHIFARIIEKDPGETMKRFLINAVIIGFVLSFSSVGTLAWDDVGHKITGYIAWQRMSPKARENVIKILRSAPEDSHLSVYYQPYGVRTEADKQLDYFMLVPTWADIVRDRAFPVRYEKYHKGDWHYTSVFWRQANGRAELIADRKPDGQAIEKLAEFEKALRDPAVTDRDKAVALAWFLHIGGDIHQPLHTSSRVTDVEADGDRGGNTFLISPQGAPRAEQQNLHWFWDSIVSRNIPFDFGLCEGCYVKHIADSFISRYSFDTEKSGLALSSYATWKDESLKLAQTEVFRSDLKRFETPSDDYRRNAYAVSEQRLVMAGYRMGETLNEIFGNK